MGWCGIFPEDCCSEIRRFRIGIIQQIARCIQNRLCVVRMNATMRADNCAAIAPSRHDFRGAKGVDDDAPKQSDDALVPFEPRNDLTSMETFDLIAFGIADVEIGYSSFEAHSH